MSGEAFADESLARVASAPGRINLLGEHVDHQGGTVLPLAIQWRTTATYTPGAPGDRWTFVSEGHDDDESWTAYARGVVASLAQAGVEPAPGRVEIKSALPEARGLSSSAALEVAIAGALDSTMAPMQLAEVCRRAEHEHVGVPCGLMDQAVAACAIGGHVMALDCSDATFYLLAMPDELELHLFDLGLPRRLGDTPYAERQAEARTPGTAAHRHVVEERARVEQGIACLDNNDARGLGELVSECHASLRDLYRCSLPAADALVDQLLDVRAVYGARLIGAGWGGCVLALTEPGAELQGSQRVVADDGLIRLE